MKRSDLFGFFGTLLFSGGCIAIDALIGGVITVVCGLIIIFKASQLEDAGD